MDDQQAGYTGVVYSDFEGGYTTPGGCDVVIRSPIASGYTGTATVPPAPVASKGQPDQDLAAPPPKGRWSEVDRIRLVPSPYDRALASRGKAPGSDVPIDYRPAPPQVDPEESKLAEEGGAQPASPSPSLPPGDDPREVQIGQLTAGLLEVDRQIRQAPEPAPNEALARAQQLLEQGRALVGAKDRPPDLLGPLADAFDRQVAEIIAQSTPSNLGVAYLQGMLQEVLSTMAHAGAGAVQGAESIAVDPAGTVIRTASDLLGAIQEHMAGGESFWEAVNSVLNPAVRVLNEGWEAAAAGSEATEAARRGDQGLAVRLARESGRRTVRSGVAAAETVALAAGAAALLDRLPGPRKLPEPKPAPPKRSPRPKAPPEPPPPRPEPPHGGSGPHPRSEVDPVQVVTERRPRPDGLTGTVVHDGAAGPQLPAIELSKPHAAYPQIPRPNQNVLQTQGKLREQLYRIHQAEAAAKMEAMPPAKRLDPHYRLAPAKVLRNDQEWLTARDLQLAHPENGYLTNVKLVSVVTDMAEIPTEQITKTITPEPESLGRVLDVLEARPSARYGDHELKTETAIEDSYPAKGVQVGGFKRGTKLSEELRKTDAVFDYAKTNNGKVRVKGWDLFGKPVELELDPNLRNPTVVAPYRQPPS